jgi:hypothetical protein
MTNWIYILMVWPLNDFQGPMIFMIMVLGMCVKQLLSSSFGFCTYDMFI